MSEKDDNFEIILQALIDFKGDDGEGIEISIRESGSLARAIRDALVAKGKLSPSKK